MAPSPRKRTSKPIIAIIPGDCTGIGPEQTARILAERRGGDVARLVYVADKRVLDMGMRQASVDLACSWIKTPAEADWSDEARLPAIDH